MLWHGAPSLQSKSRLAVLSRQPEAGGWNPARFISHLWQPFTLRLCRNRKPRELGNGPSLIPSDRTSRCHASGGYTVFRVSHRDHIELNVIFKLGRVK